MVLVAEIRCLFSRTSLTIATALLTIPWSARVTEASRNCTLPTMSRTLQMLQLNMRKQDRPHEGPTERRTTARFCGASNSGATIVEKWEKGVDSADGAFAVDQSGPDSLEGRPVGDPEHAVGQPGPGGGTGAGTVAGPDGGNSTAHRRTGRY